MSKSVPKAPYNSDTVALKFKSTPDLLNDLKSLAAAGPTAKRRGELILSEIQFRGENTEAAALIANIDQQRKKFAEEVAEINDLFEKRGSKSEYE